MNRTYKVAKSLTRGVVVTSEKASSYQGKAVKTVVAAAVALMATGAFAAATDVTLDGKNTKSRQIKKLSLRKIRRPLLRTRSPSQSAAAKLRSIT